MDRRGFVKGALLTATGALMAQACAGLPQADAVPTFASDRLSVVARGQGPDVILIPGLSCPRDVWDGIGPALERAYRVHYVQLTGFGEPTAPPPGPLFEPAAQELIRYIREQELERPALIGHSMGGTLTLRVAAAAPELISRGLAVDTLPFFSVLVNPAATAQTIAPQAQALAEQMRAMTDEEFAALQVRTMATLTKATEHQAQAVAWSVASNRAAVATMMQDVMTTDLRPQLSQIAAQITVLYAWDPTMPFPAAGADIFYAMNYAGLEGVRLVRVDEALHFIMLDQPARFEAEVLSFLQVAG